MNEMRKNLQNSLIAGLVVILILLLQSTAFAAYNSMPEKMYPQLQETEIANVTYNTDTEDIADVEIHLKFSNNVGAIQEENLGNGRPDMPGINAENLTRFSMVAEDDPNTPINITVTPNPDAAMHTDESKYFFIFANGLDVNKEYIITVDKNLYANMGNSLACDYQVHFKIGTDYITPADKANMGPLPAETAAQPLYFSKASIETNAVDVELTPTITMTFAYNVSGDDVLQNNITCISLMKGTEVVPIEVSAGDNVTDFVIQPTIKLIPSTEYRLIVTTGLMARNGNYLSSPVELYFTTVADQSAGGSGSNSGSGSDSGSSSSSGGTGSTNTPAPEEQGYFTDVKNSWALEDINWLADRGIVSGNPDGEFLPENTITRAEIAAILARAFDLSSDQAVSFKDVSNHWANAYISAAAAKGILSGVGNGNFAPDAIVTREQLAVMLVRAGMLSAVEKEPMEFTDESQLSFWASEAVKIASSNGIISGYPDGTFRPSQDVTRAEACRMIVDMLKLQEQSAP
jgi:hypothetical protein